jgi:hypothetical protein
MDGGHTDHPTLVALVSQEDAEITLLTGHLFILISWLLYCKFHTFFYF